LSLNGDMGFELGLGERMGLGISSFADSACFSFVCGGCRKVGTKRLAGERGSEIGRNMLVGRGVLGRIDVLGELVGIEGDRGQQGRFHA
jgi:hypothetical protein